jgi:hypothetical protein
LAATKLADRQVGRPDGTSKMEIAGGVVCGIGEVIRVLKRLCKNSRALWPQQNWRIVRSEDLTALRNWRSDLN